MTPAQTMKSHLSLLLVAAVVVPLVTAPVHLLAEPVSAGGDGPAEQLRIGWGSADLTPERHVLVAGMARARVSDGVADPLAATALAIESVREGKPAGHVIMVSCDLLYIVNTLRDRVREHVKESLPESDPKSVVLNATHTHNSAETYTDPDLGRELSRFGLEVPEAWSAWGIDLGVMSPSEYTELAAQRIAEAVEQAWEGRTPTDRVSTHAQRAAGSFP